MACASSIMTSLLEGLGMGEADRVVWLDIIPNRFGFGKLTQLVELKGECFLTFCVCVYVLSSGEFSFDRQSEFARATLDQVLSASGRRMKYVGFVKDDKISDLKSALESKIYEKWDPYWNIKKNFET